jgi:hypothetical protein
MNARSFAEFVVGHLYEPSFRKRYGEELRDFIESRGEGGAHVGNLLLGALRSRLSPGVANTVPQRRRLRDQKTVTATWTAFCLVAFIGPATQLSMFDPAPVGGDASAVPLMTVAMFGLLVNVLLVLVLGATMTVMLAVSAARRRDWGIVRPLLIAPGVIVLMGALILGQLWATGRQPAENLAVSALLLVGALAALLSAIVGVGMAVRRAEFSATALRALAYACLPVIALLAVELILSLATVVAVGPGAWTFAPDALFVIAIAVLAFVLPSGARSLARRA